MKKHSSKVLLFFLAAAICVMVFTSALFPLHQETYFIHNFGADYLGVFDELKNNSVLTQDFHTNLSSEYLFFHFTTNGEPLSRGSFEAALENLDSSSRIYHDTISLKQTAAEQSIQLPVHLAPGNYRLTLVFHDFADGQFFSFSKGQTDGTVDLCQIDGIEADGALQLSFACPEQIYPIPWLSAVLLLCILVIALIIQKKLCIFLFSSILICSVASLGIHILLSSHQRALALSTQAIIMLLSAIFYGKREALQLPVMKRTAILKESCIVLASLLLGCIAELGYSMVTDTVLLLPRLAFFCLAAYFILWCVFHRKLWMQNLAPLFLVTSLTAGIALSFFAPATTLVSWDDEIHYANTVYLSQGIRSYFSKADTMMKHREIDKTFSVSQSRKDLVDLEENSIFYSYKPSLSSWMPNRIGYLPHVIGIWIGQILSLPFQYQFLAGRLGSALLYCICIYWGMKRLKSGQSLLFLVALLPTVIFQSASYSYDGWLNILTLLGFSYFIGEMQRPHEPVTTFELCIILLAPAIGCLPKAVYGCILPIFLLMPKEKFADQRSYKRYLLTCCAITAVTLATYVVPFILQGAFTATGDSRGGDVSGTGQLAFIFSNPIAYTKILLGFLKDYLNPNNSYGYTGFLAYLGGTDIHWIYMLLLLSAALLDRKHSDHNYQGLIYKIVPFTFLFGTLCLAVTALYISFNPVGNNTVNGFQPRYIIPLLYPASAFLLNFGKSNPYVQKTTSTLVPIFSVFLLFLSIWNNVVSLYTA